MIGKSEFELLSKGYAPIVSNIINSDVKFFRFRETIKWCFGYDEDESIMACCNRNDSHVTINLKSFMKSYFAKDLLTIEYYLLHEIRHAFQHSIIKDYKDGLDIPIDEKYVKLWIQEGKNYVTAVDKNGNLNKEYFFQDSELDAYAFSFAVMKYKYGNVSNLYVPEVYGDEFNSIVEEWISTFREEEL